MALAGVIVGYVILIFGLIAVVAFFAWFGMLMEDAYDY